MRNKWIVLAILAASLLTRFIFFGHPDRVVFDEVHFGKFISGYSTHEYYFDIHPPLGKLLIAGFGKLTGFQPEFSFATIGDRYPNDEYRALRFLPTLASSLLPLVIFGLALELGFKKRGAITAASFIILDNAILAQSRFILLDSFLLLFGFTALWMYFRWHNGGSSRNLFGMAVFGALAASIKWTGLTFLALPFLIEAARMISSKNWRAFLVKQIYFAAIPLVIYFGIFWIHFALLTKSGTGDAFMSTGFQKTLAGNMHQADQIPTPNIVSKFVELNAEMYRSNARLDASHPYSSKWYTWPFMLRPIYYWVSSDAPNPADVVPKTERIYLIGNPFIWWLSTIAFVWGITHFFSDKDEKNKKVAVVLIGGFALNLLPFIGIGRVMFLYHYLTALVFTILMLAYILDKTRSWKPAVVVITFATIFFVYFAPLTYGTPLTGVQYNQRVWLPTWR